MQEVPFDEQKQRQENKLKDEYAELLLVEENLYTDKARIMWLEEEDRNTGFFHIKVLAHKARNQIMSLTNEEG